MSEDLNKAVSTNTPSAFAAADYNFREIEKKWQQKWIDDEAYKVPNDSAKPKYYVLDMFPYPSGAGLHVGHPLGYIASDIYARYKRLKGFNVLHPMGYDAFGLPAEQYAIEHGVHPAESTAKNIATFRSQLDKIGFSYDWSREVNTSNPNYYKWTQWIFLQLFKSWYNRKTAKTEPIDGLVKIFEREGNTNHSIPNASFQLAVGSWQLAGNTFSSDEWQAFDEKTQQTILMEYRVACCGYGEVNWCEALGTVLANDEVVNGVSERGGYPVEKKRLRQWYLRITEYADRLLQGLQTVDFSEAMKEMQSNWIGKSSGAEISFDIATSTSPPAPLQQSWRGEPDSDVGEPFPKYKVRDRVQFENARRNRKNSTAAELRLWEQLRDNKLGFKFRRQHPVDGFITDFACVQVGLIVELDGGYHNDAVQQEYDQNRTSIIEQKGFTVLRFNNEEVMSNPFEVRDKIKAFIASQSANLQEPEAPYQTKAASTSPLSNSVGEGPGVRCYTTRPDTIFGVDFLVIAPEHELVSQITTPDQQAAVDDYITYVKSRSERERMAEKKISGVFTGAYAINPFNGVQIPVWISEYVLAGYGTGAIMAVPSGDERDHKFAKHFQLPITNIIGDAYNGEEANPTKDAVLTNSGFLNGMAMRDAIDIVIDKLESLGIGKRKVNYKMRDAAFSRQRYWGEPFPIIWKDGVAYPLDESELPLELPHVDKYGPGPEGEGPLANISEWTSQHLETNTMPGYAGSSWYFLRYMNPHNDETFCDKTVSSYWNQVDLYVGGTEHAVGHLLYSRMWTKALYDLGFITFDEPFKKLLNQGMIQGKSFFVDGVTYLDEPVINGFILLKSTTAHAKNYLVRDGVTYYSASTTKLRLRNAHRYIDAAGRIMRSSFEKYFIDGEAAAINDGNVDVDWDIEKASESGEKYLEGMEIEKMSKSKFNVENPDDIVNQYGADTFRMYEMFLGPIDQSKPWDTKGIEGVHRFLKKLWRLYQPEGTTPLSSSAGEGAGGEVLKTLHRTIKKIEEDTERFSYNTAVSAFMVCVNELTDLKCNNKEVLQQLLILLTPYAPHISEELWHQIGNSGSILDASYPTFDPQYLVESSKEYPVSINGKLRTTLVLDLSATEEQVREVVMQNAVVQKWIEGKEVKKFIFVKNKMINVVI